MDSVDGNDDRLEDDNTSQLGGDDAQQMTAENGNTTIDAIPDEDSQEVKLAVNLNPDLDPAFVRYLVLLGKQAYLTNEYESMVAELEFYSAKEAMLKQEKDDLVQRILLGEIGCVT